MSETWQETRDRWLAKGFNIHAYHGFKAGPLPGCNTLYGNVPCGGSIEEHCHCGSGDHLPIAADERLSRDEPPLSPLSSYPVELEIVEVRKGEPGVYDDD